MSSKNEKWKVARHVLAYIKIISLLKYWFRLTQIKVRLFAEMRKRTSSNNIAEQKYEKELAIARQNGVPLASPRLWRREMAFLDSGYRISLKDYKFEGRCFFCDQNNKSAGSCFFNRQTKNARAIATYERHLVNVVQLWADKTIGQARHPEEFKAGEVRTFPDPDLIRTALDSRVPKQHMLPTLSVMLFAEGFRNLLPVSIFLNAVLPRRSTEPFETYLKRKARVDDLLHRPQAHAATRWRVWHLVRNTRREWNTLTCNVACRTAVCVKCRRVKRKAQVKFCRDLDTGVSAHLQMLYRARKGIFRDVPTKVDGSWNNSHVRVERCVTQSNIMSKKMSKKVYCVN